MSSFLKDTKLGIVMMPSLQVLPDDDLIGDMYNAAVEVMHNLNAIFIS